MPTNKQKVYDITSVYLSGQVFTVRDLHSLIEEHYPGTPPDSIIPSDYLYQDAVKPDPSNDGNRHHDTTYPRFLRRVGQNAYSFGGWDGQPPGAIEAPVTR